MPNLADLGLSIADVNFGGIDAESDTGLEDYFVTTPYVSRALKGRRTIFLGRKGSGKSALFQQIPKLVQASDFPDRIVLSLTPDQYAWSALRDYKEQGILEEQAHTNAWKFTSAVEAAGAILSTNFPWALEASDSLALVRKFMADNYGTISPGLGGTAKSILKGLKSFNLSAFGFGAGMSRDSKDDQPLTPAVASQIMTLLKPAIDEIGLIVVLDRLDDSWDGSVESSSLLVGLLKAAKDLNDQFRDPEYGESLRIVTFLRSDIYDNLKFDDKDKHRSLEQEIQWTPDLLREMVQRRLPGGMQTDELFERGEMRGSIAPFNYLVKRTFQRPREVLQFLDECLRVAGDDAVEISKDNIRKAEERYSAWKVSDLKQEYAKAFPDFDSLVESLRQERHRYETLQDLSTLLVDKRPKLVEKYGRRALLERLFEYSVIGVRLSDAGSTRFKSEDSTLALPSSGAAYVHQSLYKGLNIKESRRRGDEDEAT